MNCKSGLADILRKLSSHFQEIQKEECQVNGGVRRVGGSETSLEGGSLSNSQTSGHISLLNQSLNLSQRSPFLDAALSLMGYRVPHICNATTDFLVNTLISVLLSTITCKFLLKTSYNVMKENVANTSHGSFRMAWQKAAVGRISESWLLLDQGFFQIGSYLSFNDFSKLLEACESIFQNLEAHGNLFSLLRDAVLKVAISMTSFKVQFPLSSTTYKKISKEKYSPLKLLNISVKAKDVANQSLKSYVRLHAWRLQPSLLKQDMENILMETMQRPLLHFKHELHHRDTWRSIVLELAAAPDILMEARFLFHKWFLLVGSLGTKYL